MGFFETLSALIVKDGFDAITQARQEVNNSKKAYAEEKRRERIRALGVMEKCFNQHEKIHEVLFEICTDVLRADHQKVLENYSYLLRALIIYPYFSILKEQGCIDDNQKEFLMKLKDSDTSYCGLKILEAVHNDKNENPCRISMSLVDVSDGIVATFWNYVFANCGGTEKNKAKIKKLIKLEIGLMNYFCELFDHTLISYDKPEDYIQKTEETLLEELEKVSIGNEKYYDDAYFDKYFAIAKKFEKQYKPPISYKVVVKNNLSYKYNKYRIIAETNIARLAGVSKEYAKTIFDDSDSIIKDGLSLTNAKKLIVELAKVNIEAEYDYSWTAIDEEFNIDKNIEDYRKTNKTEIKIRNISIISTIVFFLLGIIGGAADSDVLAAIGITFSFIGILCSVIPIIVSAIENTPKGEKKPKLKIAKYIFGAIGATALMIGLILLAIGEMTGGLAVSLASLIYWTVCIVLHIVDIKKNKKGK